MLNISLSRDVGNEKQLRYVKYNFLKTWMISF